MTPKPTLTPTRRGLLTTAAAATAGLAFPALVGCGPRGDRGGRDADVIVVGAGLSGLHAALLLQAAGARVIVLEADRRVGGRMRTLDDLPGRPEAGGQQVGASYARVRARCAEFGLAFADFPPARFGEVLHVDGVTLRAADWADSPVNRVAPPFAGVPPHRLFFSLAARENPLSDVYAWRTPEMQVHDIAADEALSRLGAGPEALRLMEVSLNGDRLATYSMMNAWRSLALYALDREMGPSQRIAEGSQRLPEAMADALDRGVRLNAPVAALQADADGAAVRLETGRTLRADFLVAAVPFAVLRRLVVEAPLPRVQAEAVQALPYTPIVQLHLEAEAPFWETDGLAPEMWTDTALERVFAGRDADGAPTGALTCWLDGLGARAADPLSDAELEALARGLFRRVRPASEGRVRLRRAVRWTESDPLSGGAYMHWPPGRIADWAEAMTRPAGRLHIAGEHAGHLHTGMEAAMEAGERAAAEILERTGS